MTSQVAIPPLRSGLWRILRETLAKRVDSAFSMVEADQFISGYCSEDIQDRQHLVNELENAFNIQLDASTFETIKTVGELAALIAASKARKKPSRRSYIIVYRNTAGNIIEEHVSADNHEAAIEFLRTAGLDQVLSVSREEDENEDYHGGHGKLKGGLLTVLLALLAAGGVVFYFWMRSR